MARILPVLALLVLLPTAFGTGWFWQPPNNPPPAFSEIAAGEARKTAFFSYLTPLIRTENERILSQRNALKAVIDRGSAGWAERRWLQRLATEYELDTFDPDNPNDRETLLHRVDQVPPSMALAQAANESAWGTSRFAREGNNYFGQWCFQPGCGLVPNARNEGAEHEVARFRSPRNSVRSYMNNINTHSAYRDLRARRAAMRAEGQQITGLALIPALTRYSERGQAYVNELAVMIKSNNLHHLDP